MGLFGKLKDVFFEELIVDKIKKANEELDDLRNAMEIGEGDISELSSLISHKTKYIASLNSALVRLKNGTFGVCEQTGEEISKDRLKAVPNSNMSTFAKDIINQFGSGNKKKINFKHLDDKIK